jgi:hypothetical protein
MKAVKSDPDPAWGSVTQKVMFFHTGSDLTAFLFFTSCRTPHDSRGRKWGRSEGNRDTVCNRVIDDDVVQLIHHKVSRGIGG